MLKITLKSNMKKSGKLDLISVKIFFSQKQEVFIVFIIIDVKTLNLARRMSDSYSTWTLCWSWDVAFRLFYPRGKSPLEAG